MHTPGPWIAKGWSHEHGVSLVMKDSHLIAGAYYLGGTDPALANATLIAAAPDMLSLLRWLDRKGGLGHDVHDQIEKVIAKATVTSAQRQTET